MVLFLTEQGILAIWQFKDARTMDGSTVNDKRLAVSVLKELRVPPTLYLCSAVHVMTRNVVEV